MSLAEAQELADYFPTGFFHGDCWHGNFSCRSDGSLLILDPIPTDVLFPNAPLTACGALDLATLHMSLSVMYSLTHYFGQIAPAAAQLSQALNQGYLGTDHPARAVKLVNKLSQRLAQQWIGGFSGRMSRPVAFLKGRMALRNHQHHQEILAR